MLPDLGAEQWWTFTPSATKQDAFTSSVMTDYRPVAADPASSEIPMECDQNGLAGTLEPGHDTLTPQLPGSDVSDDSNLEFIEPALVEVDQKMVIHEEVLSKLQQNAAPPLVILSDDLGLLSTLFGSDEELPMLGLVPEGPVDVTDGWSEQTATVERGNQDQFRPLLNRNVFGDWTHKDPQGSVPLPPQATPLPATAPNLSDKSQWFMDLPRIVKLKPSSITFSDYSGPDYTNLDYNHLDYTCTSCKPVFFNLSSDGGGSSQEEEDNDDDEERDGDDDDDVDHDVFLDVGASPRCKGTGRKRRWRKQSPEVPSRAGWCAVEQKTNGNGSPWCESMSRLMKKLDQLNLDIEEALSSGSSPSHTPAPARRRQDICRAVRLSLLLDQVLVSNGPQPRRPPMVQTQKSA
ncbi:unnamed protein product [Lota lota]